MTRDTAPRAGESGGPVPLVVGVTAHRDLVADEIPVIAARVRRFLADLAAAFPDLPLQLLCPLAEGGDRIVAREARALGIPLIVPLPFARTLYLEDFADAASRREFDALAADATVVELPGIAGIPREAVSDGGLPRDLHYAQLGVFISGHCQVLLAIWDGKRSDQLGGTADVVRFHHEGEMDGYTDGILDPQQILADSENDLVYHIVCSRDRPDGAPAAGLVALDAGWYCADPLQPRQASMPARYESVFRTMEEFNRDSARHRARIAAEARGLDGQETGDVAGALREIDRLFRTSDWLANHFQKRVSSSLVVTYLLAVMMGLAFILYTDVPEQESMIFAFLGFFAIGLGLFAVAQKGEWHRKYLDYRGLAEGLRVQYFWTAAGVTSGDRIRFAHDNFLQKQDVELGWIRNVMRYASLDADLRPPADIDRGLALAMRDWIGNPDGPDGGQIQYYERRMRERSRKHRFTRRIGMTCLWAGLAVTIVLAIFSAQLDEGHRDKLILLMGVLPLIAAVREAYANKKAEKELIKQYRFMHRIFLNARRRLLAARTPADRRAILRALGDAALDEHAEWILMHRERPLEHSKL